MNVAFFGIGTLGYPMAEKLLERGHKVFVYNRTRSKAASLSKKGAIIGATPDAAARQASCIILVLTDYPAIEQVLFKKDIKSLKGKTVIQMSTIGSRESQALQQQVRRRGGDYIECPVLGSKSEAAKASLILMVGSSPAQFKKWRDLLECFGPQPRYIGPVGRAATLKLALNHLIAAHASCFSLSLGLVRKSGIDVDQFMSILSASSLITPMYAKKLPNWMAHRYNNPNFSLKHLIKDVNLILKEAQVCHIDTTIARSIRNVLKRSAQKGWADKDYSAVYETINNI